ncbi:glycerol-3-phosphate 1-O-acyltransferase PlsY [candidate division CSSED10-310 bacterium]|uniref:Glycerol-3-phosphate acyltransferase n=1 Tax=candidate division CSSED10-310 bacterium TaxID=2855610 RepID=A0ABV6YXG1_UNCC1
MVSFLCLLCAAYILGSIPSGILVSKLWAGTDIRRQGSGNIGATNVYRNLGLGAAGLVFAADVVKGGLAVSGASYFLAGEWAPLLAGLACVLGHMYSLFLGFKGGKGVATGFGVFLIISPLAAAVSLVIWLLFLFTLQWVSVASMIAALGLPIIIYFTNAGPEFWLAVVVAFFIVLNHRQNISRLLRGVEPKIGAEMKFRG